MSYNYEYLSDEKKIAFLLKQLERKEERLFELSLADQEDAGIIGDTEVVTAELANLKSKLAELEE
tara:strand:- start:1343 stop:1537 length:195 start_codon:yes stop_codon:yes gene_type:complete